VSNKYRQSLNSDSRSRIEETKIQLFVRIEDFSGEGKYAPQECKSYGADVIQRSKAN